VEEHEGTISVKSKQGEGSTFTVTLRDAEGAVEIPTAEPAAEPSTPA